MNYEVLQAMPLDTLIDLLVENTTELLKAIEKKDRRTIQVLQKQLEMIQEIISLKKAHQNSIE